MGPPTELSYGKQKLISLARVLMNDGNCLLLDEPMAGVEGGIRFDQDLVRGEADAGRAVASSSTTSRSSGISAIRQCSCRRPDHPREPSRKSCAIRISRSCISGPDRHRRPPRMQRPPRLLRRLPCAQGRLAAVPARTRGVVRPQWSGKSTLFKGCVGSLTDPHRVRRVHGAGGDPGDVPRNLQLGIGFVPQARNMFEEL